MPKMILKSTFLGLSFWSQWCEMHTLVMASSHHLSVHFHSFQLSYLIIPLHQHNFPSFYLSCFFIVTFTNKHLHLILFFMCMSVLSAYTDCVLLVCSNTRGQKRASRPLKLEWEVAASGQVGAGNWAWPLKEQSVLPTTESSLQPPQHLHFWRAQLKQKEDKDAGISQLRAASRTLSSH